jgi:phytoene synthase
VQRAAALRKMQVLRSSGMNMPDDAALEASYAHCRRIARSAARNFYYGFRLLPPPKHRALCALYAFMRWVDDISDAAAETSAKQSGLDTARDALRQAVAGNYGGNPILPAFRHTLETYGIPQRYIEELIAGAEMDLSVTGYSTFADLRAYCYRVAGTVGQCCVRVFGACDEHSLDLAERLGLAFQLTNILRDLSQDLAMGRVYLPREDFGRFHCAPQDLAAPPSPALREMLRYEADRAWRFYREGAELLKIIPPDSRAALWALGRIYSGILDKIEAREYDVTSSRVRLSAAEKTGILVQARCGWWSAENGFEKRSGDGRRTRGAVLGRGAG